jgi:hypothetical protein
MPGFGLGRKKLDYSDGRIEFAFCAVQEHQIEELVERDLVHCTRHD